MDEIGFRPMEEGDLPLVARWLAEEHVREWWRDPYELEQVTERYLPAIRGDDPTDLFVIVLDTRDIGMIESYRLADHPDWRATIAGTGLAFPSGAGMDYLVGDAALTGRGIGTAVIDAFVGHLFASYADVDVIVVTPQVENRGSCRVLEKAGFELVWTGMLDSDDPADSGVAAMYVLPRPPTPGPDRPAV